jgi:hypothetical protein
MGTVRGEGWVSWWFSLATSWVWREVGVNSSGGLATKNGYRGNKTFVLGSAETKASFTQKMLHTRLCYGHYI